LVRITKNIQKLATFPQSLHRKHNIFQNYTSCGGTAVHIAFLKSTFYTSKYTFYTTPRCTFKLHRGCSAPRCCISTSRGLFAQTKSSKCPTRPQKHPLSAWDLRWLSEPKNTHLKPQKSLKHHPTRGTFEHPFCSGPRVALSLSRAIRKTKFPIRRHGIFFI